MRRHLLTYLFLSAAIAIVSGCRNSQVDFDWQSYGLDWSEQRFSPADQIDTNTIKDLGLAWSLDLPVSARGLEATPLEVNGVLYFTTSLTVTYAVDAISGKVLWTYDPESWRYNPRSLRLERGISRGVAYGDGAIFVGASDGRLISLNAKTGKPNWITKTIDEPDARKQITGAPRVFKGMVIIGNSGADFGTRGYVTAYDIKTGKQRWRFYTVPGDPKKGFEDDTQAMAAKTWTGEWWKWGGGGTVWNAITFDPEFNRIYIGTGNSANYDPAQRSPGGGDNLFLASIVALDADTGKYVWHYQVNPREAWDFKATTDMVLADVVIDEKPHKVLMQAPTNGFFYVLDRATGKLISAEKLGKVTWADRIDLETGRPVERPGIRYENGPITFWPSPYGIHNWQPMSYSPKTGLVYIPTMKMAATYSTSPKDKEEAEEMVVGSRRYWFPIGASFVAVRKDPDDGTAALVAWDPVAQKPRWTVKQKTMWNGGTLVTAANVVFQGTADGWLYAFDATIGKELWKFYTGNGVAAGPISYTVKGTQYITVLAGYLDAPAYRDLGWRYEKHLPRVLTFKIGGKAVVSPTPPRGGGIDPIDDPALTIDKASSKRGAHIWEHTCELCHGTNAESRGMAASDLRESAAAHDYNALRTILKDGALASSGMPQFDERTDAEIRDLQMFIRDMSRKLKNEMEEASTANKPVR